jgi:hypothetical protein
MSSVLAIHVAGSTALVRPFVFVRSVRRANQLGFDAAIGCFTYAVSCLYGRTGFAVMAGQCYAICWYAGTFEGGQRAFKAALGQSIIVGITARAVGVRGKFKVTNRGGLHHVGNFTNDALAI